MDSLCIIAVVERGKADKIVEKAKDVGARGATVFYGRGTGESEVKRFLNISSSKIKQPTKNLITLRSRGEPNSGQVKMHILF